MDKKLVVRLDGDELTFGDGDEELTEVMSAVRLFMDRRGLSRFEVRYVFELDELIAEHAEAVRLARRAERWFEYGQADPLDDVAAENIRRRWAKVAELGSRLTDLTNRSYAERFGTREEES